MTPFGAIVRAKAAAAGHALASARTESKLKIGFVSTGIVLLWVGTFGLAKAGFSALDRVGVGLLRGTDLSLVDLLIPRVLSIFTLVLFVLLVLSSALLAHATLYRSREMALLVASPVGFRAVFFAQLLEIVTFSSWSTAFLGSPVVLAYGLVRHSPWPFYFEAAALFIPFVVIPSALGSLLALLAVRLIPRLPRAALVALTFAVIGALFAGFRAQVGDPRFRDTADLSRALRLTAQADSPFLPSFWLANGVVAASRGVAGETAYQFLLLLANAVFLVWVAGEAAQRLFHAGWSNLAGAAHAARFMTHGRGDPLAWLLKPLRGPARWLTIKDIRLFLREPAQWSQFLIFFGTLLLYVASMRPGPRGFATGLWQSWITLLNSVASLLVLATLTTRFVFPLVSLEGRRIWILGHAPLSRRLLVTQKFWLSVAFTASITVGLAAISAFRLRLGLVPLLDSLFTVLTASLALSGLAVGLGSLFPNFSEVSPSRIVSGLGGTLTFILSAVYVVVAAGTESVVLHWHRFGANGAAKPFPWVVVGAVALNLAVTIPTTLVPLALGARNLERLEV